jgi:outer membrane murein-binding lipoprotein Lpp
LTRDLERCRPTLSHGRRIRLGWRKAFGTVREGGITSMRRTLAWVVVAVVLIAGCGGGSDSKGSASSSEPSAGDTQYIDPFQNPCLSRREVRQKIDRIASEIQNSERKQRAIRAVRHRAC